MKILHFECNKQAFSFGTSHSGFYTTKQKNRVSYYLTGDYAKTDNYGNSLSGAFNRDYSDISRPSIPPAQHKYFRLLSIVRSTVEKARCAPEALVSNLISF